MVILYPLMEICQPEFIKKWLAYLKYYLTWIFYENLYYESILYYHYYESNMKKENNILWANIKKVRNELNLTQEQLSKKADISYTSLTKIETGVIKDPSVYTIAKIAKAFDVTIESLLIDNQN